MPYNTLPVRVQRFAYRTFSQTPDLDFAEFERQLGKHFFGANASPAATADLLELQRIWSYDSDWYWASPLLDPAFFAAHAKRLQWPNEKLAAYERNLTTLRGIATRNAEATNANAREMARLAKTVVDRWDAQANDAITVTKSYAMISLITSPCTSVSRRSMPLWRNVSAVCSIPSSRRTVACRS